MYIEPAAAWILFGKGGRAFKQPGNKRYLRLISEKQITYHLLKSNADKAGLVRQIQQVLCDEEGRKFVELNKLSGLWEEASQERTREKIRTALCGSGLKNALKIEPPATRVFWPSNDGSGGHGVDELVANFERYEALGGKAAAMNTTTQFLPLFVEEGDDDEELPQLFDEGSDHQQQEQDEGSDFDDDDYSIAVGGDVNINGVGAIMTKGIKEQETKGRVVSPENSPERKIPKRRVRLSARMMKAL